MSKKKSGKPLDFPPKDKSKLDNAKETLGQFSRWGGKQLDDLAEGGKAVAKDIGEAVDQGITDAERFAKRDGKKTTEFQKMRYGLEDWWRREVKPVLKDLSKDVQGACNSAWSAMSNALDKLPDDAEIGQWVSDVWKGAKQKIQNIKNFSIRDAFNNLAEKIGDMVKSIFSGKKQEVAKSNDDLGQAKSGFAAAASNVKKQAKMVR